MGPRRRSFGARPRLLLAVISLTAVAPFALADAQAKNGAAGKAGGHRAAPGKQAASGGGSSTASGGGASRSKGRAGSKPKDGGGSTDTGGGSGGNGGGAGTPKAKPSKNPTATPPATSRPSGSGGRPAKNPPRSGGTGPRPAASTPAAPRPAASPTSGPAASRTTRRAGSLGGARAPASGSPFPSAFSSGAGPGAGGALAGALPFPGRSPLAALAGAGGGAGSAADDDGGGAGSGSGRHGAGGSPLERTIGQIVKVVPDALKVLMAALAALGVMLAAGSAFAAARARRLGRQRRELLGEVGLLQEALLPPVPAALGALRTSVAYRPADGPGAGGDFYDVFPLPEGRVGFVLGDVSGHGRDALAHTAFLRYTLRAYLEAGLEPRLALQVAGRVVGDGLGGDFATALVAVHDPASASLSYAGAGHPPPLVLGPGAREPVTIGASPPVGVGLRTGLRQTTVPLPAGAVACMYTDGLAEARLKGTVLGRERLRGLLAELGWAATADELIERVARTASRLPDDMAACVLRPEEPVTSGGFRSEELELGGDDLDTPLPATFLAGCGVSEAESVDALEGAHKLVAGFGGAVLRVRFGTGGPRAAVLPRNVESLEAASRRARVAS